MICFQFLTIGRMELNPRCMILMMLLLGIGSGLDNGLARTPPMGWLSWERFRCNVDCVNDPSFCISESLFKGMANLMVKEGYRDAGYQYINVDDCWLAKTRASDGHLQPDPSRFPNGIKALADYIHEKGLKFGIYEDFGTKTCAGYPGSEYYMQMDAQTFADWGVDFLKLDGCNSDPHQYSDEYPPMAFFLNMTKRHILLSCEYPLYQLAAGIKPNYPLIAKSCNIWRNYNDIEDSWDSIVGILKFYGKDSTHFAEVAGPGHFNDPDELVIGNYGLSYDQERVQMGMWCMLAAPLIMSVDLRTIRPKSKALLLNRHLIAINQDPLGYQARRIIAGGVEVWTKRVNPEGSLAIAFVNYGTATPAEVAHKLEDLDLVDPGGYNMTEVFENKYLGAFKPAQTFQATVNPSGIYMAKAVPLHQFFSKINRFFTGH